MYIYVDVCVYIAPPALATRPFAAWYRVPATGLSRR